MSSATPADQVLRIRDGQILLFRDFSDPRIFEELAVELRLEG